jgi:hypothetical protein
VGVPAEQGKGNTGEIRTTMHNKWVKYHDMFILSALTFSGVLATRS